MMGTSSQPDPTKPGMLIPIKIALPECEEVPLEEVIPPKEQEAPRKCT